MSSALRAFERQDKPIKATLAQLVDSVASINALLGERLPIRQAFQLSKIAKAIAPEVEQYHASYGELVERYAERDEQSEIVRIKEGDKDSIKIQADKRGELEAEYKELIETEVTIPGAKLSASQLGINISPTTLMPLEWLLDD